MSGNVGNVIKLQGVVPDDFGKFMGIFVGDVCNFMKHSGHKGRFVSSGFVFHGGRGQIGSVCFNEQSIFRDERNQLP
mgnify:CR=1 FL=1